MAKRDFWKTRAVSCMNVENKVHAAILGSLLVSLYKLLAEQQRSKPYTAVTQGGVITLSLCGDDGFREVGQSRLIFVFTAKVGLSCPSFRF